MLGTSRGDCLAGVLPVEGLVRGGGRPYARPRARRTLPARSWAWPGLPQGSPREARSREVAKKSPRAEAPETGRMTRATCD